MQNDDFRVVPEVVQIYVSNTLVARNRVAVPSHQIFDIMNCIIFLYEYTRFHSETVVYYRRYTSTSRGNLLSKKITTHFMAYSNFFSSQSLMIKNYENDKAFGLTNEEGEFIC